MVPRQVGLWGGAQPGGYSTPMDSPLAPSPMHRNIGAAGWHDLTTRPAMKHNPGAPLSSGGPGAGASPRQPRRDRVGLSLSDTAGGSRGPRVGLLVPARCGEVAGQGVPRGEHWRVLVSGLVPLRAHPDNNGTLDKRSDTHRRHAGGCRADRRHGDALGHSAGLIQPADVWRISARLY